MGWLKRWSWRWMKKCLSPPPPPPSPSLYQWAIPALQWYCYLSNWIRISPQKYVSCYDSTALCWDLADFPVSWSYTQSVGVLGWGICPSQGLYLRTEQHNRGINAHDTDMHALSGIRTQDLSVPGSEDSSCLDSAAIVIGISMQILPWTVKAKLNAFLILALPLGEKVKNILRDTTPKRVSDVVQNRNLFSFAKLVVQ
jgi:hypothetical protein